MSRRFWKRLAILAVSLLASFLTIWEYGRLRDRNSTPSTVVTQIEKLSELVTVRYRIQRVVGLKEAKEPFGEESILLMVEGEVQSGVDLKQVKQRDIALEGTKKVRVSLPPPRIFNSFLDEKKTKVWDRQITWWTPWVPFNPDLEHQARLKALDEIRQAALDMGILNQARTAAASAVQDLLGAAGIAAEVSNRGLD